MSEWIRLTPKGEKPAKHYRAELVGNQHRCWHEHEFIRAEEPDLKTEYGDLYLSTTDLANIPWVKALIQATRKDGSHSLATELRKLAWSVDDDELVEQVNEWADKLDAALKPFAGVTYE